MKQLYKILILFLLVILLVIFFYPKQAGYGYGGYVAPNTAIVRMEYSCFGIKYSTHGDRFQTIQCADCGVSYWCSGIPYNQRCYEMISRLSETENQVACGK